MKKQKILKIGLITSFLPYAYLLLKALYHTIWGYDVYTWIKPYYVKTVYGLEAFLEVLVWDSIILCIVPVLPLCFLYQLIYLIAYLIKKRRKEWE
ncbi:hypothetical protein [Acetivibrio straminisolvens]|jgi:hypothetical protein|uniref:Uncharacterized protein n=1 Tax=Acetivibrio straminisolvens JCM 21531 TaxID=1294263 RepID=W4VAF9_9FIRM|nr:hypothetical protein [Acetivibrio straminisolvens]GAE90177.1 hypothetical protein JCM21531_3767 [Acetivibrio straminisolvens JCM 21531]